MVGDTFVNRTARGSFLRNEHENAYTINNFEVGISAVDKSVAHNPYITSRLNNAMVNLFNGAINMPKIVVVVLEEDLINEVSYEGNAATECYAKYLTEIIDDFHRITTAFRQVLPNNAKKQGWPKLLMIPATLHDDYDNNNARVLFNDTLEAVAQYHNDVCPLKLLQVWDPHDHSIYSKTEQRYINGGVNRLWSAIDRTIAFCNRRICREDARFDKTSLKNTEKTKNEQAKTNNAQESRAARFNPQLENRKIFWNRNNNRNQGKGPRMPLPKPPGNNRN